MSLQPPGLVWIDAETKVAEAPADHRADLRLWLRLLTCTTLIETEIRRKLQASFGSTLPRFDLLAQLDKAKDGLVLGEVSKRLMVSAGNVTTIVDRLLASGHITRNPAPHDRRVQVIRMTPEGRAVFKAMAGEHGDWIGDMFDDLAPREIEQLMGLLAKLKGSVRRSLTKEHWRMIGMLAVEPPLAAYAARHVLLEVADGIATLTLNRPERKNPLTFESYAELVGLFRAARSDDAVKAFVVSGAGDNFSSGGDVHDIIGPLVAMKTADLLRFTGMTGDLVKAMRACPQPIVAAVDGVCAGAGAIVAMASDLRLGTPEARVAFLFNRVGLAGCDMGACAILPRLVGQGRASELLYTGRALSGEEGERWGFFNRLVPRDELRPAARDLARRIAEGPGFATGLTKRMLHMEWAMGVDDAVEAEAVAQALCMKTEDFGRAYRAFAAKAKPVFEGD